MVAFLGVPADERLLDTDLVNLPHTEQHRKPVLSTQGHDRLARSASELRFRTSRSRLPETGPGRVVAREDDEHAILNHALIQTRRRHGT